MQWQLEGVGGGGLWGLRMRHARHEQVSVLNGKAVQVSPRHGVSCFTCGFRLQLVQIRPRANLRHQAFTIMLCRAMPVFHSAQQTRA